MSVISLRASKIILNELAKGQQVHVQNGKLLLQEPIQRKKLAHHAYRKRVLLCIAVASIAVVLFLNGAVVNISAFPIMDQAGRPIQRQSSEQESKMNSLALPDPMCESKLNSYLVPVDFGGVKVDASADCGGYVVTRKK
ncbi:MAG: hypothetical protein ACKOOD_03325 [Microbacteriaceae bacterium]